jgi:hypothetical protein
MDSVNMVLKLQFDYAAWARLILFIKPPEDPGKVRTLKNQA